ncbi:hypothetical protein VPH35_050361 [Triticum aestivum]
MARNEEKAQSLLNRFTMMKEEEKSNPCRDLANADRWRGEILREIGAKLAEIQNEGLGEHHLSDLNDQINKLLHERGHWERLILELGGHDYSRSSNVALMTNLDGNIIAIPNPSGRGPGYRYFGAAKNLPGIHELFDKPPEVRKRGTRYGIHKRISGGYCGYYYYDDEDGALEPHEAAAEGISSRAPNRPSPGDFLVTEWHRVEREAMKNVPSGEVAASDALQGELKEAKEMLNVQR